MFKLYKTCLLLLHYIKSWENISLAKLFSKNLLCRILKFELLEKQLKRIKQYEAKKYFSVVLPTATLL